MANQAMLSCPLCLRAGPPDEMVLFNIEHHAFLKFAEARICQPCCEAIGKAISEIADAGAAAKAEEPAPPPEPDSRVES